MPHFERHVFVCVNERAPENTKGCCSRKGGAAVRAEFKKLLIDRGINSKVRANNSGCLDQCAAGAVVVVYPEQVWYGGVAVEDVKEIVDSHIIGGTFVQRLMMPNQEHLAGKKSAPPL